MQQKIQAAGIGGALATVIVWTAGAFGVDMPPEVGAAFAAILSVGAGWFKSDDSKP